jgi:hypothetical protein
MPESPEPLPLSLRALVDAEKACPDPQPGVADKVFSRLTATLGIAATAASAPTAQAATLAPPPPRFSFLGHASYRTLATFFVGATVGAASYATVSHVRSPSRQALPTAAALPAPDPALPHPAEVPLPPSPVTAPLAPVPSQNVPSVAPPSLFRARDEHLAAERNLIEMARTSLARGRADGALATLRRHSKQFPRGQLSEERDSLLVQALVTKGDYDQARQRAVVFRRHYPSSLFAPAVAQALQSIP